MSESLGRVLFVTWAGGGNIHPLVVLGTTLVARGHDVRVLGPPGELADRFDQEGLRYRPHRLPKEWYDEPDNVAEVDCERVAAYLRGLADDVRAEIAREPTDLVVVDYMQVNALSAAESTGLPFVAFVHTLFTRVAASETSPMAAMSPLDPVNELRTEMGLASLDAVTDLLDRAPLVLVATAAALDRPDHPVKPNVRYVGPLVEAPGADAGWQPPPAIDAEPLVVVSMGTTDMEESPILQRILDALAELPVQVLATVGDHLDPADFVTGPNTTVSRYVRHAAVLPHARLVVDHAGLGVVNTALAFGLPQVCVPLGREQPDNAQHVVALDAGRVVDSDAPARRVACRSGRRTKGRALPHSRCQACTASNRPGSGCSCGSRELAHHR